MLNSRDESRAMVFIILTFLNVTTKVTVRLAHSVVRINTAEIQMYWVNVLPMRYNNSFGMDIIGRSGNTIASESSAMSK